MLLATGKKLSDFILDTKHLVIASVVIELLLFYFYYFPETKVLMGDEVNYYNRAMTIISGDDWHTNPLWPPLQSVLIALFVAVFGESLLPLQIFQYGLLLLAAWLVRDITFRETKSIKAAQLSLAVMILYPSWLAYSHYLWPEVIHVTLFVSMIWIVNYKFNSLSWMMLFGVLLAMALMFKSLLILFVPVLYWPLLKAFLQKRLSQSSFLLNFIASLMMAVLLMVPATHKAHQMTGGWMVANSSMFNLWFGLNDDVRQNFSHDIGGPIYRSYMSAADDYQQRNEVVKDKALEKIKNEGLITTISSQLKKQYFRLFDHQSFFSQQFQGSKKENYINKYHHGHDDVLVSVVLIYNSVFYFFIMLGLCFGLFSLCKTSAVAQQFLLFVCYVLGLFILLHTKPRFRIPLMPMMAFYSGCCYLYLKSHDFQLKKLTKSVKKISLFLIILSLVILLLFSGGLFDKVFPI